MKLSGSVRVPGDKSISHRALMVAALARGRSELSGLLSGDDVKSTARVLRRLGVDVSTVRDGAVVTVQGGRFSGPRGSLDCGNSGTTARLSLGLLAGQRFGARLTGDASLRRRPMRRGTQPPPGVGGHIKEKRGGSAPPANRGGGVAPPRYP